MPKSRPAPTISWFPWWLKGRMGRWLLRSVALVLLAGGLLAGVIGLGRWTREQLHDDERYQVALADIECDVPEGMERRDFLDEVQYHSRLPDRVNVLDDDVRERLQAAFQHHPWVEHVDRVTVAPPQAIEVRLTFRVPVLAVRWDGELRAVDRDGILLPKQAVTQGLPLYDGTPLPPRGPAGTHWGDTDLERAAHKVASKT